MPLAATGRLFCRRCAMPVARGHEAHLLLGVLSVLPGSKIPQSVMLEGTGAPDLRFLVSASARAQDMPEPGWSANEIFKRPNWGWEAEPLAFQTTLRLAVADGFDRAARLQVLDDPTPEEVEALRDMSGRAASTGDHAFSAFRRILHRIDVRIPSRVPLCKPQLELRRAVAEAIVRELRDHDIRTAADAMRVARDPDVVDRIRAALADRTDLGVAGPGAR